MKIAVVKRDKIGDMLLSTPMFRCIKNAFPDSELHVIANDYNAWVLTNNSDVDKVWTLSRARIGKTFEIAAPFRLLAQIIRLRKEGFDVAIVGNGYESYRAIRLAGRLKAKSAIGYCDTSRLSSCLDIHLRNPAPEVHELDRLIGLLSPLGIPYPSSPPIPRFEIDASVLEEAGKWCAQQGLGQSQFVMIGTGARREAKQLSSSQILTLAETLKLNHGLDTVLTWTPAGQSRALYPGDDSIAREVLERNLPFIVPFPSEVANRPEQFGQIILRTIGILWRARVSVFPDSGLMHFAAASPGGVVGLFANPRQSASPAEWGPRGSRTEVIVAEKSISDLPVEELMLALTRFL